MIPWERQEGEPSDSFELFSRWLNEPPTTSVGAFAASLGVSVSALARMAAAWRWIPRRKAWAAHLHRMGIEAAEAEARDLGKEAARHLSDLVDLAGESIRSMAADGRHMNPRDALAVLVEAAKQAALGSGKPTAILDLRGADNASIAATEAMLDVLEQNEADHAAKPRN